MRGALHFNQIHDFTKCPLILKCACSPLHRNSFYVSSLCGIQRMGGKRTKGAVFMTWRITSGWIRTSTKQAHCYYSLFSSGADCGEGYTKRCLQHGTMTAYSIRAYSYRPVKSLSGQGALLILDRLNISPDLLTISCKSFFFNRPYVNPFYLRDKVK